jgi:hypothetical protein
MSTQTQAPARPRRGQDAEVKGNPYAATFMRAHLNSDDYLVQSASSEDVYLTSVHHEDAGQDRCSCLAMKPCWHISAARLRQQIERWTANAENFYRNWSLAQLQGEDARLRAVLAEADSWLTRAQYGVICDLVLACLAEAQEVA